MNTNTVILGLISFVIYNLALKDELLYYIHPRYIMFSLIASAFCLFIVIQTFGKKEEHFSHEHHTHKHNNKNRIDFLSWTIIFVLISALFVPTKGLTHTTAVKRFQKNPRVTRTVSNQSTVIDTNKKVSEKSFAEWISELDPRNSNISSYQNKKIDITGFVFIDKDKLGQEYFFVTRFFLSCCIADATPLGIQFNSTDTNGLKNDDWIRIQGKILILPEKGHQRAMIVPDSIEIVPKPEEPYAYF